MEGERKGWRQAFLHLTSLEHPSDNQYLWPHFHA